MEKIIRDKEVSYVRKETLYIAKDGTEFDNEESCLNYEKELMIEDLKENGDVEVSYEAMNTRLSDFMCDPYLDDEEFIMLTPKTDEAVEVIKSSCTSVCVHSVKIAKGEPVCVRIRNGVPYDIMGTMEMRYAVAEWCRLFGRRVEFYKEGNI